ncbi:MAG: fructose-6-phosphate aldolase [Bacteroidia bacterium]|nr:fructose-6-phosphate aldolase [Bacteroidia bacterium]MCC6768148.1 fructose-6-phosphate aldolase [Bacteroidia bacterium]
MYVLKIRGTAKIPDYIQLRSDDFTLKAYFRLDRPEKTLEKLGLEARKDELMKFFHELPFGKIVQIT